VHLPVHCVEPVRRVASQEASLRVLSSFCTELFSGTVRPNLLDRGRQLPPVPNRHGGRGELGQNPHSCPDGGEPAQGRLESNHRLHLVPRAHHQQIRGTVIGTQELPAYLTVKAHIILYDEGPRLRPNLILQPATAHEVGMNSRHPSYYLPNRAQQHQWVLDRT
jgi:hypothetical protein